MTEELRHESYALVQFVRCSGNPKLYGSALDYHNDYIKLAIKRSVWRRSDTGDRFDGPTDGDLIEVGMSMSQYAELLTSNNIGLGVPCTIQRLNRKGVEPPPSDIPSEGDNIKAEFKERIKGMADSLVKKQKAFAEIMAKKNLTKADREAAAKTLDQAVQELTSNAPFFLEMFQEATEKVVHTAKAEVAAFMAVASQDRGVALPSGGGAPQLPLGATE